jgi:hypothetical protein
MVFLKHFFTFPWSQIPKKCAPFVSVPRTRLVDRIQFRHYSPFKLMVQITQYINRLFNTQVDRNELPDEEEALEEEHRLYISACCPFTLKSHLL